MGWVLEGYQMGIGTGTRHIIEVQWNDIRWALAEYGKGIIRVLESYWKGIRIVLQGYLQYIRMVLEGYSGGVRRVAEGY